VCVEQADVDMVLLVPSPTLVLDNPINQVLVESHWQLVSSTVWT
jgi:hypothetical protein